MPRLTLRGGVLSLRGALGTRNIIRSGVVLVTAALVLAGCATARSDSPPTHSARVSVPTATLYPSSLCGSDEGDNVHQSLNGDFTGCFRVPTTQSSSLVVALQTYLSGISRRTDSPTTTLVSPATKLDHVTLSLSRTDVTPGQNVVVSGHLSRPLSVKQPLPTLCWDSCAGLQEEGATIHWTSSKSFRMILRVPDTAWLVASHGAVTVHPLTSGNYEVGVQCLTSISGCALGPAQAQTTIHLNAPRPKRCVATKPCATMSLSATRAAAGDAVLVTGWAPLQLTIGQPFSYALSVAGTHTTSYPALSYTRNQKGGGFNVVLSPRILHVVTGRTWSHLSRVAYVSSTYSGPSAIAPLSDTTRVAWCQPSNIVITGDSSRIDVPTVDVRSALKGSTLHIFSNPSLRPECATVQLDPRYAKSVYAGFNTAQGNSIPPVYLASLYTTNAGITWRRVPTPPGTSIEDFSGFTTQGNQVDALFRQTNSSDSRHVPWGTSAGLVSAEVTSNGGRSWSATTLGCPPSGPCVSFGPYYWGNCNMGDATQPLLLGPPGTSATSGVAWTTSALVSSVDSCFAQQLVVSSSRELWLVDPSSQYPLQQSTNSGRSWTNVALPVIAAANYGVDSEPTSNSLVLASDGSLFAVITTPSGRSQELFRLAPSATSWCLIPNAFGTTEAASGTVGPLRVSGANLLWSQTVYSSNGTSTSSMHSVTLSSLRC
ncbi:MAG: hypothetical protein ACYCPT_09350 [Acidimicrobiales bacterium]